MPGNRAIYDRAMEQAQDATQQEDWPRALKEGLRALQELPRDVDARITVATALYHTDKLAQALQLFEELHAADAQNPVYLEFIARIKHRQGDPRAAVAAMIEVSALHQQRRLPLKALEDLHEALEIDPTHEEARIRLAYLLLEVGDRNAAIAQYVTLGRQYLERGDEQGAREALNEAVAIDPDNKAVRQLRADLERKEEPPAPEEPIEEQPEQPQPRPGSGRLGTGPLRSPTQIDAVMTYAADLQNNGDIRGAAAQYERVLEAAPERADAAYSLGLLYAELDEAEKAIAALEQAANDDEYALSAHFTLGNIYQSIGKLDRAAQEYEQTLRLVDLQTIGKDEAPDLIQMYESAASIYEELGDIARAASLYSTLAGFLQGKRWGREQAEVYNRKAKELGERSMFSKLRSLGTGVLSPKDEQQPEPEPVKTETWGRIPSITDFLNPRRIEDLQSAIESQPPPQEQDPLAVLETLPEPVPIVQEQEFAPLIKLDTNGCSELVQRYVEASARFTEQTLYYAALDACHEVIRHDLSYMPIHLRLGEIYERMGWHEQALSKYQMLIETYEARGETARAIEVYYKLLDLSPDSTTNRSRLSELLREAGRQEEAAAQLAVVANTHYRMGQNNKALDEFRRVIQWAPNDKNLRTQYGQLLLKLERFEAAVAEFRRVVELDPNDVVGLGLLNIALTLYEEYPSAIWDSLAALLEKLRDNLDQKEKVVAEYRSALLIVDRALLHYLIGVIEKTAGSYPSAVFSLEQALALLEIEPDEMLSETLVRQLTAECYLADGQPEHAIEELRRCEALSLILQDPPKDAPTSSAATPFAVPLSPGEIQRHLAEAYAEAGDLQGAITALQEVKRLLPYDRMAYTKLAEVYFRQGRLQEALAQLDELATYYENKQQLDRAIETLESAVTLAPNNVAVRKRLAYLYLRRGYLDKGLEALEELSELQRTQGQIKDAVQSLQSAADVHWTLGRQDKAYALYDRIVQLAPNDIEARSQLVNFYIQAFRLEDAVVQQKQIAKIFLQQKEYQEAIGAFHQVIALAPNDTQTYEQLGDVLMRVGEYEQAVRLYKRLARLKPSDDRVDALQAAAQRMLEQREQTGESA